MHYCIKALHWCIIYVTVQSLKAIYTFTSLSSILWSALYLAQTVLCCLCCTAAVLFTCVLQGNSSPTGVWFLSKLLQPLSWTAWSSEATKSTRSSSSSSGSRVFIWMETLSREITRKETRAVAFGQGLRLAVWPGFHSEASCVTRIHTHSLPRILCTPLLSAHSLSLWISGCYFIAYTRERERRIQRLTVIEETQGESNRERENRETPFPNVKPGYCLIHSTRR